MILCLLVIGVGKGGPGGGEGGGALAPPMFG